MRAYTKGLPALGAIILTLASVVVSVAESNDPGCRRQAKPVTIHLSAAKYPDITRHIKRSWSLGYPKVLTIHRRNADERRERLLRDIPTRKGYDRDEAPAAVLRASWRADVAYVESGQNRSAGASLGNQISPYCSGQRIRYSFG